MHDYTAYHPEHILLQPFRTATNNGPKIGILTTSKGVIPRPIGGAYLKHAVNVIVYFEESISYPQAYKATLIKHRYSKTPRSVIINVRKTGRMLLLGGS
jgi:hypothetical protein